MKLEIVCLAKSKKMGGRCVAGVRTDGGGWVRPIARTEHGELDVVHRTLRDGSEPKLLDVLAIRVGKRRPEPHQPENWEIIEKPWRRVERSVPPDLASLLHAHLHDGSPLFGTPTDRVSFATLEQVPAEYSLALVAPEAVEWLVAPKFSGGRQVRAQFEWGGVDYDLVVTDPIVEARLLALGDGRHSSQEAGFATSEALYLTISLGEPFNGYCFKLVAAAFVL